MQRDPFATRADPALLPEWMDEPASDEDMRACLRDLAQVNAVTLAHRPTLAWLRRILARTPREHTLRLIDVGCGGGDMLRHIARWSRRRGYRLHLVGIDLNPQTIRIAREFSRKESGIEWVVGDAVEYATEGVDLIISSLVTHHLRDEELVRLLAWMERTARRGWFVNNLYRSESASRLFGLLARVARWHRFVQHDGPVSIRRSFREADWRALCISAGLPLEEVRIAKVFPSRLCVGRER